LVIPLTSLAIYSLLLQLFLAPIEAVNGWLAEFNPWLLRAIHRIVSEMASWPLAVVEYRPGLLQVALIFAAVLLLVDWLSNRNFKRILQLLLLGIMAALLQIINPPI